MAAALDSSNKSNSRFSLGSQNSINATSNSNVVLSTSHSHPTPTSSSSPPPVSANIAKIKSYSSSRIAALNCGGGAHRRPLWTSSMDDEHTTTRHNEQNQYPGHYSTPSSPQCITPTSSILSQNEPMLSGMGTTSKKVFLGVNIYARRKEYFKITYINHRIQIYLKVNYLNIYMYMVN